MESPRGTVTDRSEGAAQPRRPRQSWSEKRAARFQRRVELWEERRANPSPRKLHRAIITIIMMAMMLMLLVLLVTSPSPMPTH
jgi:hypothetical protein